MALKGFTPPTWAVNTIQLLADQVKEQAASLKSDFDLASLNIKNYTANLLTELQDVTSGNSGSNTIGHNSTNVLADNVGDGLEELAVVAKGSNPTSNVYSVLDYGLAGLGLTGDAAALNTLITNIGATEATILFPSLMTSEAVYLIDVNVVVPKNINLAFNKGATLKVSNGISATGNLAKVTAGPYQIFDLSLGGTIEGILNIEHTYPEWWGAVGGGVDDTVPVQAAFDFTSPTKFAQNYYVVSVEIQNSRDTIYFNSFKLIGITSTPDTDSVLELTGNYLEIHDLWVDMNFNTDYKCAIHWHSPHVNPSQNNKIYGYRVENAIIGTQYGNFFSESVASAAQSENFIYGWANRSVEQCLNTWITNGFLTIIGGAMDCNPNEWVGTFNQTNACVFDNRKTQLTVSNCELLKTTSQLGYGMKGFDFTLSDCTIEVASAWIELTGGATITNIKGLQSADTPNLIDVVASSEGLLKIDDSRFRRPAVGRFSGAYVLAGLAGAAGLKTDFNNCEFEEWNSVRYADVKTEETSVKNCYFFYDADGGGTTFVRTHLDQVRAETVLPTPSEKYRHTVFSIPRAPSEQDTMYVCVKNQLAVYVWRQIQVVTHGTTGQRPLVKQLGQDFFDTTLGIPIWWDGANWIDAAGTTV